MHTSVEFFTYFSFISRDTVNSESSLNVENQAEELASLLDGDDIWNSKSISNTVSLSNCKML